MTGERASGDAELEQRSTSTRQRHRRPQTGFGISPDDQVFSLEDDRLGDVMSNPLSGCGYPPTVQAVTRYSGDDFYCDVAIPDPGQLDVVYEDELVLAFRHTRPFWETHIVVVPKRHIASLATLSSADEQVARRLLEVVRSIAAETERSTGAAAVLTNLGDYQDSKHLHIHVHSGSRRQPNS